MATTLPPVPNPPPPTVQRFDAQGRPTREQVIYETQVQAFLKSVKTAVEMA